MWVTDVESYLLKILLYFKKICSPWKPSIEPNVTQHRGSGRLFRKQDCQLCHCTESLEPELGTKLSTMSIKIGYQSRIPSLGNVLKLRKTKAHERGSQLQPHLPVLKRPFSLPFPTETHSTVCLFLQTELKSLCVSSFCMATLRTEHRERHSYVYK